MFSVRRLLDADGLAFERLEVAELVEAPDAVLQRFGVEDAGLDQPDLAADDVVARRGVADERDAVDEVLLPFVDPHRDVDDRRAGIADPAAARPAAAGRRGLGAVGSPACRAASDRETPVNS